MKLSAYFFVFVVSILLWQFVYGDKPPDLSASNFESMISLESSPSATWYVSMTGNDFSGDGTSGNPFRHIQYAVDIADDGDAILVNPGTYEEHVQVNNKRLSIMSTDPNQYAALYSDTSRCFFAIYSDLLFLYGLSFRGQVESPSAMSGGAVRIEESQAVFLKCKISDSRAPHNGGGLYAIGSYITFDSSEITNNQAYWGDTPYSEMKNLGGGIYCIGDECTIKNSLVAWNYCGVEDAYGGGVAIVGHHAQITNTTFTGNTAEALTGGVTTGNETRGGGLYIEGNYSNISHCYIDGNRATSSTQYTGAVSFGGGVFTLGLGHEFNWNQIVNNEAYAEFWDGGDQPFIEATGGGAYLHNSSCLNNTFVINSTHSHGILENEYCHVDLVSIGGGAKIDDSFLMNNIFAFNFCDATLDFQASCAPGCVSYCDRFLMEGSGVSETLSDDECNIYYGNTGTTEWGGGMMGPNFNVDPQFCDMLTHDYTVSASSPALPANNSCGSSIGALGQGCSAFTPGDANGDKQVNVGDAVFMINYVFKGGPAPDPLEAGDANCDSEVNVGDPVYLINYVFKGGPEPCCP